MEYGIQAVEAGSIIASDVAQVNEKWLSLFLAQKQRKSSKTAESYERELRKFFDWMGPRSLDTVDLQTLSAYIDTLAGKASATQARITTTIRSFFKFLAKDGVNALKVNPAAALEMPEQEHVEETAVERVLTEAEAGRFMDALRYRNYRNYLAFAVILSTGLRISELCGATWGDIFEDNAGNIGLRVHGKGNRRRIVKLRPDVWKRIREYRQMNDLPVEIDPTDGSPLIANKKGEAVTDRYLRKVAKEAAEAAGIKKPVSPHWFRHTHATLALEGGADVEAVRRQLGHSSLQHTTRYLHNTKGLRETAADHVKMGF